MRSDHSGWYAHEGTHSDLWRALRNGTTRLQMGLGTRAENKVDCVIVRGACQRHSFSVHGLSPTVTVTTTEDKGEKRCLLERYRVRHVLNLPRGLQKKSLGATSSSSRKVCVVPVFLQVIPVRDENRDQRDTTMPRHRACSAPHSPP